MTEPKPRSQKRQRAHLASTRLNDAERAAVLRAASGYGCSVSEVIRRALFPGHPIEETNGE